MKIIDNLIETGNFRRDTYAPKGCGCATSVCAAGAILIIILLLASCNNQKKLVVNKNQNKEIKTEQPIVRSVINEFTDNTPDTLMTYFNNNFITYSKVKNVQR